VDDDYGYLASAHVLHGARSRRVFRLGDRVRVRVLRADAERRLIDFGLAGHLEAARAGRGAVAGRRRAPASDRRRHTPRQPARGRGRGRR